MTTKKQKRTHSKETGETKNSSQRDVRNGSLQRLVRPIALKPGDKVKDDKGRIGIVVKEWGSFSGCPQCTKLVWQCDVTPCCGVKPTTVSGKGVFEVRMADGKVHSINHDWLTCVVGPNRK